MLTESRIPVNISRASSSYKFVNIFQIVKFFCTNKIKTKIRHRVNKRQLLTFYLYSELYSTHIVMFPNRLKSLKITPTKLVKQFKI